ncbi:MAG: hypothetical protein JW894_07770 [Bacteroidales bacterium]|nr:hypothetical protein [Bacteroidales bacterium]
MFINRNNYESIIIDYLDGKLNASQKVAVELFLDANPDIAEEIYSVTGFTLQEEYSSGFSRESLLKSFDDIDEISTKNFEEFCIAYYEKDLSKQSEELLFNYVKSHPENNILFELYGKIKFDRDNKVQFSNKGKLLKPVISPVRRILYYTIPVAAAILLFILFRTGSKQNFNSKGVTEKLISEMNILESVTNSDEGILSEDKKGPHKMNLSHDFGANNEVIAVFDTNNSTTYEKVLLASIKPINANIGTNTGEADSEYGKLYSRLTNISVTAGKNEEAIKKEEAKEDREKVLFWEAIELSLKGIGALTENNLALYTETDDRGKLKGIKLQTEKFEFERRIKRNINN